MQGEKVLCGFLSWQLGEQSRLTVADEMDEIVQAELQRGGMRAERAEGHPFKSFEGHCIDVEMSPSKSSYLLSE